MAPTLSKSSQITTPLRTPQSKHRNTIKHTHPSPNPNSALKESVPPEHPVEVVSRIRDYPDQKEKFISALHVSSDQHTIRVRTEIGYRDFSLDGVSVSEEEDLEVFYKKFVESRINGVKLGEKCTVMMYGPTGSGKSHTMFGCPKQPGIVYRALRDILGPGDEDGGTIGSFVQVTVLEIYNEEIYDLLLNSNGGGLGIGWPKGNASKVKLEVMGKKAKNATFLSGNEAGKISREVAKVEKRRIVKSTNCNERSSRSHCMIILDVPTVGGRLMLVDMAGSENIEQAGQVGFEAKMQTAKINQGNTALKRVVESIANGDSHVPFRDSKLTMLLQDSFEDDKSKILMILCASPDPKEMHKTISTLEYGAKAKCIIRGGHTPNKDKNGSEDPSSTLILGSRIAAMDQFIFKLQMENKRREKERNEAHKELMRKEEEVAVLRAKLELLQGKGPMENEEEINLKVNERTHALKLKLEKKIQECQKMAHDFVELGKRKMEEKILQQDEELEMLRRRLEDIESELHRSRGDNTSRNTEGLGFASRLMGIYANGDCGMEKSMDLDMGDPQPVIVHEVKEILPGDVLQTENFSSHTLLNPSSWKSPEEEQEYDAYLPRLPDKVYLSTVFEEEENEGEERDNTEDVEVEKEIVEETTVQYSRSHLDQLEKGESLGAIGELENSKEAISARLNRIHNIFMLCGNQRELCQNTKIPTPKKLTQVANPEFVAKLSPLNKSFAEPRILSDITEKIVPRTPNSGHVMVPLASFSHANVQMSKESRPGNANNGGTEVYVKWEASKEHQGKFITKLKVGEALSLADLRKLIEMHLGEDRQGFTFLMLGNPTGSPVLKENEASVYTSKLPICNNQLNVHLACLRPTRVIQQSNQPFRELENKLQNSSTSPSAFLQHIEGFSPRVGQNVSPAHYVSTGAH
ncbi:hypothetical protein GIB67_030209 [Kingdonia uniflora]|uniref:Kinesin-like protein KIN-10A n=1 Tax=Kingdonia uniflora TaxID=39325 RepID=A0A7J7MMU1_9MAGN|nr:hypothetical protein GIB67_030209 [Kingdonia uniflora]